MSQFGPISGKKLKVIPSCPFIQTPLYFFETEENIFMTFYKYYALNTLESIQNKIFYILIDIKHSRYDRIYKSQKNQSFIKQYLWIYRNKRLSLYH
jgi:hypothetical protein